VQSRDDENPSTDPKIERILSASREIFMEMGYSATSMDLVAQRARISKTTLYTRFPSKEELYSATIRAECERRGMGFQPEEFDDLPLRDTLIQVGRRFVDLLWSEPGVRIHQSVMGEAMRMPEVAQLFFQAGPEKAIGAFVALFERLNQRGLIQTDEPAFVARQFLASLQGGPYCALTMGLCVRPSDEEREEYIAKVVDLFIRGVGQANRTGG
jgi:TetR/AcrR family transcriptional repressor of mexJK operon